MSRRKKRILVIAGTVALAAMGWLASTYLTTEAELPAGRQPKVWPDYAGVTIPPNIAPMNFRLDEPLTACRAEFRCGRMTFVVQGDGNRIVVPPTQWRGLLAAAEGHTISIRLSGKPAEGPRQGFEPIEMRVAADPIDSHLVYRQFPPIYARWRKMGLYERCLEDFSVRPLVRNERLKDGCVNCHTFQQNRPERMAFHFRPAPNSFAPGMILTGGEKILKVETRTPLNPSPAAFMSWHPSGRYLAFSVNRVKQFMHSFGDEMRDTLDLDSDIGVYDLEARQLVMTPAIAHPARLETFPCWSPDGKHLYFNAAEETWTNGKTATTLPLNFKDIRYDLVRIGYDAATGKWGDIEPVLTARKAGKSVIEPRISPDGKWALVVLCDYGAFPLFQRGADLYLVDLSNFSARRMECNSDRAEAWHGWSSNGRWIVFSSKRDDGMMARPYFAHIGPDGHADKPFLLPQEDPDFYDAFLEMYNLPELVTGPVQVTEEQLIDALTAPGQALPSTPITGATPRAATQGAETRD